MTLPQPMPYVYFHPILGWYCGSGKLSEEEAKHRCKESGIPYDSPENAPPRSDHIMEITVAGTCFVSESNQILSELTEGQELRMEREDNPHDANAIMIVDGQGRKIGYVPKVTNVAIARLMDLGEMFHAVVLYSDVEHSELRVMICMVRGKCTRRHFSTSFDSIAGSYLQMDNVPVSKTTFGFKPMSKKTREIPFTRHFSADEMWDLRWGHLSMSMDDRWNIVCTRKKLYFCRSWSGHCVLTIVFGKNDEHKLIIEKDRSICDLSDECAVETVTNLIDGLLRPISIPWNMIPNGVFGNFIRCPSNHKNTKYGIDPDDGTVTISSLD